MSNKSNRKSCHSDQNFADPETAPTVSPLGIMQRAICCCAML